MATGWNPPFVVYFHRDAQGRLHPAWNGHHRFLGRLLAHRRASGAI